MRARIAVAVDDTDDLTKTTSTGKVAGALAQALVGLGGSVELGITRHQLPMLAEIAYTSHNSSMAFTALLPTEVAFDRFCALAADVVVDGSVPDADPGLCIYRVPDEPDAADEEAFRLLCSYAARVKREYVSKEEAYALAALVPGLTLTEHGGGGEGVIGALAGVALRLTGNDGRFRGKHDILHAGEEMVSAADLVTRLGGPEVAQVVDTDGHVLGPDVPLFTPDQVKTVFCDSLVTLVAERSEAGEWRVIEKKRMREAPARISLWERTCSAFELDNDAEELALEHERHVCANCLFRRWIAGGLRCMREGATP